MATEEMQQARSHLDAHGYRVDTHDNGSLVVQDPVMVCGRGLAAGQLAPAGFQPVAIRGYRDALRFVAARS